ncbi:hypothetical protein [Tahibacter harae]|uniref:Uncharacterized protein n=1 Tax=Tahibacter harae TaxID=2963937 RepID=A0ABT1QUN8_9GAMM|nr:hypothetical protein [Tahibacter harae]MCQ4166006.1 hypothetical protein [Tahibacter harae]
MNLTIPPFDTAVDSLRGFLRRQGHSAAIFRVFRDDVWLRCGRPAWLRLPVATDNEVLARQVYAEGCARGLVRIDAVVECDYGTGATVWFPRTPEEEIQGWDSGLKLSIAFPLPRARIAGPLFWRLLQWHPGLRRFQRHRQGAPGSRRWAAE